MYDEIKRILRSTFRRNLETKHLRDIDLNKSSNTRIALWFKSRPSKKITANGAKAILIEGVHGDGLESTRTGSPVTGD